MSSARRILGSATATAALVATPLLAAPAQAAEHVIQLVGINDFHGRLEPVDETDAGDPVGGAKQLAGAIAELTAANPNTLFVSAGDNIGASTFVSNVQQDEPTIEALDAMDLAVSAVGNHEFDRGFDDLTGRVDGLADFPYLGANVYLEGTTNPALPATTTVTVDGVQIGFVGVVTEQTASLVSPAGIADIEFGDAAEAANREADALVAAGADVVVLLAHTGSASTDCAQVQTQGEFGALLQTIDADVDAVFSGHTHQEYACEFDSALGGGFTGPVVSGGQYGEAFGVVTLTYEDTTGEITGFSAAVEALIGYSTPNAAVNTIVDDAVAFAAAEGAQVLGEITADIRRAFSTPTGEDCVPAGGEETDSCQEDRGKESVLGNFIADVQLAQTQAAGAQIAFMNPGGLRDDFLVADQFASEAPGVVTLGEANDVQPFANGVVTMTLTGAQILQVLEQQWQPAGSSRPFLALGVSEGFSFTYDASQPEGSRIQSATLNGTPLGATTAYRVTVNSFLAAGGDNFDTLAEGTDRQELGVTDLEALVAYMDANSPITADTQSRRAAVSAPPAPTPTPTTTPTAAPTPGTPGSGVSSGRNRGLRVDTGVEQAGGDDGALVAGLALMVLAGTGAALVVGRRAARD